MIPNTAAAAQPPLDTDENWRIPGMQPSCCILIP